MPSLLKSLIGKAVLFGGSSQGAPAVPVMEVYGNSVLIANGDATPSVTDDTDFGETAKLTTVTRTFTIENTGTAALNGLSVSAPAGYTVTVQPTATLAPAASTTFSVRFDALLYATYAGNVTIASDELPDFVFAITGAATLEALIATLSPMLYYKFNEASGNLLNYGSETGADGVVSGATQAQTGKLGAGEAYSLDGVDDIITVANANIPNVKALTTQRWAFLVNATSTGEGTIGVFAAYVSAGAANHYLRFSGTRLRAGVACATTQAIAETTVGDISNILGAWAWVFMDYDHDSSRVIRLWKGVGGTLTALTKTTNTASVGAITSQTGVLQIGNRNLLDFTFNGLMDVMLIDSGLWTTDEMQNLIDAAGV